MAHKGQTVKQSPRSIAPGFPDWLGKLGSRERYPGARPTIPVCAAVSSPLLCRALMRTAFQAPACPRQSSCGLNHPRPFANHANGSDKNRGGNSFKRSCGYCYSYISKNKKSYYGATFWREIRPKNKTAMNRMQLWLRLSMAACRWRTRALLLCVTGIRNLALRLFLLSTLIGVSLNTRFSG